MNILIIGHAYIAPINREKWTTFAHINKDDVVTVVYPRTWQDGLFNHATQVNDTKEKNCTFVCLDAVNTQNELKYRYRTKDLIHLLKKTKPDVIYVEQGDYALSYFHIIFLSIFFAPRAKRLFFTWVNWKPTVSLKHSLFFGLIGKINRYFSHGAVVGNYDAQVILEEKKFKKPILVLPQLGIKVDPPNTEKAEHKTIGFVGRLVHEKGIFDLLHAFFSIHKNFPEWKLLFIGDGPEKTELIKTIKDLHLKHHALLHDAVPHEEIFTLLNTVDILVLPSYDIPTWREQFGHILIEAMALKIPIIGSTGGEIPNVIGNAGCIFTQRNISDLALKMSLLMKDPQLRASLGEKGFERVKQEYSHEIIAEKSKKFLNHVLTK